MTPWKLPLIVAAVVVPIVAAFELAGPGVGFAAGALVAVAILVVAARQRPEDPIGQERAEGERRRVLIVAAHDVEDPADVAQITRVASIDPSRPEREEVRVLVPARIGFLDRWASDVEGARHRAQQRLVVTVAALAKVGVAADARVGDEDVVQAVEDEMQTYRASDVVLVSGPGDEADDAEAKLRSRLRADFQHVRLGDGG